MAVTFNRHQVHTRCGWVERPFEELQPGDVFRVLTPAGALEQPEVHWRVCDAPIPCEPPGNWILNVERADFPAEAA